MNRTLAVAGALAVGTCLSPDAWATPLSASMHLRADADMEISDSESDSDGWIGVPTPLSVQVLAEGGADGFESFANVGGLAEAFWAPDGSSGSVLFDDYGWDVSVSDAAYSVKLNEHGDGDDWTYTFVADADGVFSMEYLVTGSGSTFGLWGWAINWSGLGGGQSLPGDAAFSPDANGVFLRDVLAGQTYTVGLSNNANLFVDDPVSIAFQGFMDGSFEWEITATTVPEPSTWALLTLGLAVVGWKRRR